jgi:hypothetical protein
MNIFLCFETENHFVSKGYLYIFAFFFRRYDLHSQEIKKTMNETSTFCSGVKRLPQTPDTTKRKHNVSACTVCV